MRLEKILLQICSDAMKASSKTYLESLEEAFEERNEVKLLKKRALAIETIEKILKDLDMDNGTLKSIVSTLSYSDLSRKINYAGLNEKDKGLIKTTFKFYSHKHPASEADVEPIKEAKEALFLSLNEALEPNQKEVLEQICLVVDECIEEQKIIGNLSLKKLLEKVSGKIAIYKQEIKNISSQDIKQKLGGLFEAIVRANEFLSFAINLKTFGSGLLSFMG